LELTSRSKVIAFAEDLIILTTGATVAEAEQYMNLELRKIQEWAQNKMKFNENKSKVMLISRRKRKKKIDIYINNKTLKEVNSIR